MLDGADPENGGHVSACHVGADITAYENSGLEKCENIVQTAVQGRNAQP